MKCEEAVYQTNTKQTSMPKNLNIKYTLSILPHLLFMGTGGYYVLPHNLDKTLDRSGTLCIHRNTHSYGIIHNSTVSPNSFCHVLLQSTSSQAKTFSFHIFKMPFISVELYKIKSDICNRWVVCQDHQQPSYYIN